MSRRGEDEQPAADMSDPSYQGRALMEIRNGLVVAAAATPAGKVAEREGRKPC